MHERIAGGEDAHGLATMREHLGNVAVEGAGPRPWSAPDERSGKSQVARSSEHERGGLNGFPRLSAQPRDAILADADDGQPGFR